jgi:hypothetical protein
MNEYLGFVIKKKDILGSDKIYLHVYFSVANYYEKCHVNIIFYLQESAEETVLLKNLIQVQWEFH